MRQNFSNNLDSPVPNGFILGYEGLKEVMEHSRHEAVGDCVFFLVPAFSSNFFVGCWFVRLTDVQVQVMRGRTLFDQDFDISPYELGDTICNCLPLFDEQNATHHVADCFLKQPLSN